jgi:putative peptide zinc metalloprotease protein
VAGHRAVEAVAGAGPEAIMEMQPARLRDDLVFSTQETPEGLFHVVKDPSTGRFFRFREAEFFILKHLESAADPGTIRAKLETECAAAVPPGAVERFIDRIRSLGLIAGLETGTGRPAESRGRIRGNPLYLRVKVCDPDRLFGALTPRLGFFFTPAFLLSATVLILATIGWSVAHTQELAQDLGRLLQPPVLLFAWLMVFAVTILHESAHGITCKRFGGGVHEVGVMLIYLQLAFYCNVSDAWLFPQKAKRLWVTFSGAFFELFLWALATVTWRITEPDTWVHLAALVVMATSGVKCLFNLNPLIKLDGYYLLSDFLDVPNLRSKAFAYLGNFFGRLWGRPPSGTGNATPREKRIFIVYGLLASVFSFLMLGLILLHIQDRLVARYQGIGFLIFAAIVAILFRNPLRRLLSRPLAALAATGAASIWKRRPVRASLLLAAVFAAACFGRMPLKVSGEFKIMPSQNADIVALTDGVIEEVPVEEGARVGPGDLIARISDRDWRAELEKTEAEIQERRATLRVLQERRVSAGAAVEKGQERLKYGRVAYRRLQTLSKQGLVSAREFDEAAEQVAVRGKELDESRSALKGAGDDVEANEAAVARLETQREYIEGQIRLLGLVTPHAGVVATPRMKEKIGQYVKKGDLVAKVLELSTVTAEIEIPEREIADVRVGQSVLLKARALAGRTFSGTVTAIAPAVASAEGQPWLKVVRVTTALDNADQLLKAEMTGTAKIICGRRSVLDLLTRRLARYFRVEFWSWW